MAILLATDLGPAEFRTWRDALARELPGETLLGAGEARAEPAAIDAAIVANPPPGSLAGLPRLALIQSLWAGVDRLLADPTLPAGVPIARMVDPALGAAMAETALWAALALHRGFFDYARQQRAGVWRERAQRRADEVTVAVLGLGEMGRAVAARLARNGYPVRGWSRQPGPALDGVERSHGRAALPVLLGGADIVVVLLPLTDETRGLFDAHMLDALRPGAGLVNLARGAHVVEADLLAALDAGRLGHAVLDVFAVEPLPAGHRFWSHPRVTVLPHVAALTDPRSAAALAAANVRALRAGRPLAHVVDRARGY
ncbi:MAG TPA: glyoxylate/hydroxypyruvate reductase A [Burkholderiaceae bacterium]